jgi:hypothetical protein
MTITGHPGKWEAKILSNSIFEQRASSFKVLNNSIGGVEQQLSAMLPL